MNEKEIMALADKNIMQTYKRFPIVIAKGLGQKVWDAGGKEYLDFVSGIAVCNLGHSHPGVIAAVKKQLDNLTHVSNLYYIETQAQLATLLEGFTYVPFNDLQALEAAINAKTCGIMLEPIQGEGGVNIPDGQYLKEV